MQQLRNATPAEQAVLLAIARAVRWTLPLLAAAIVAAAMSGALPALVDRSSTLPPVWSTTVYIGDPEHGQLVPDVSHGR